MDVQDDEGDAVLMYYIRPEREQISDKTANEANKT
jgi:hypothetical protein